MEFFGLNGWEPVVLIVVFLVIIGPQRLPEYTRNIVRMVRKARRWVDDSRETVETEMGIAVDDLRKYDPRQYDPRRIIREAWGDTNAEDLLPSKESMASVAAAGGAAAAKGASKKKTGSSKKDSGPKRAPFDVEAT